MQFVLGWEKFKDIIRIPPELGPVAEQDFHGWEYDLHLGSEVYITAHELPVELDPGSSYVIIRPGEFALLSTMEVVEMPLDTMGFISIRFSYKKLGLINISGFHVDPGYHGKVFFSVYNAGPNDIVLKLGDPVFMIFFLRLTEDEAEAEARRLGIPKREKRVSRLDTATINAIRGKSVSLASNAERITRLEFYFRFFGAIAITVIGVLLTYVLSLAFSR